MPRPEDQLGKDMAHGADSPAVSPLAAALLLILRLLLLLVLLFGIYQVLRRAAASWFVSRAANLPGTASEEIADPLRRAVQMDPADPRHPAMLARALQFSPAGSDVAEVISYFERAVALGPHRAHLWVELAAAYEWAGRPEDAQRSFQRAFALFPNSPEINWQLGNYYLRGDRPRDAARFLRTCVLRDAALRRPVFDLVWRATGDPAFVLNEVVPAENSSRLAYLDYLADTARLDAAAEVWSSLSAAGLAFDPAAAFHYLDVLKDSRRAEAMESVWAELAARHPDKIPRRGPGENLLVNGDFETDPIHGGLDWRVMELAGVEARTVGSVFYSGGRSLEIRFRDAGNITYEHVAQFIPVRPRTRYRFAAYLRAERVASDSGPRFQILDHHDPAALQVILPGILGTASWSPYSAEFTTGANTSLLSLRLLRLPSEKFSREFRGTVWLDHASLIPIP